MVEAVLRVVIITAIGALGGLMFGAGVRDSEKIIQTMGASQGPDPWPRAEGVAVRDHSFLGKDGMSCHICGA